MSKRTVAGITISVLIIAVFGLALNPKLALPSEVYSQEKAPDSTLADIYRENSSLQNSASSGNYLAGSSGNNINNNIITANTQHGINARACSSDNSVAKLLRVGFAWPTKIDPAVGSDYSSSTAFTNLYDPLVFPTTTGEAKPWVAESWNGSEDGLTWNFTLRDDIAFHSGRPLKADDVLFSMERLITIGEGYAYLFSPYVDLTASTVIDDYTVQFKLGKPFGPFLITLERLYILDEEEVMAHIVHGGTYDYPPNGDLARDWLLTHDAGSGPYKVKEVLLADHIYMDRFDDYWAEMKTDSPDEIRMLALAVPTTERTMLLKKELEISSQWLPEEVFEALSKAGLASGGYPGGDMFYYMMHCNKTPTDDIHVRKALAYAMDYETVVEEIYIDNPLAKCVVPISLAGAAELPMYRQNITAAEEELQKSKYWPDIRDHPENYEIEVHWCVQVPAEEKVAMLFAECTEDIGLSVKVVATPWGTMINEMTDQDLSPHIETVFVAAHYAEAGSLLETRYHSKSAATWEQNEWLLNETLDAQIEDALSTVNKTERYEKYAELERYILDLCPSLFLFDHLVKHSYQPYVIWPNVLGESIPVMGYNIDGRTIEVIPWGPTKTVFNVTWNEEIYPVSVVSNSTITDFNFTQPLKQISFNVTGPNGSTGFCNITIPKVLLRCESLEDWQIKIDDTPIIDFVATENVTHTNLYFTYTHTTQQVQIIGTKVIGEEKRTLLGTGWGWIRIAPKEYVYGGAELYKIGDTQIELAITYHGEKYSRTWNIIRHREYRHHEVYFCFSPEHGVLIVGLHHARWTFWWAVGKDTVAFGFPKYGRLRFMPI